MATIKGIADEVGVSSATVSRVLNYDDGISVSESTRKAIFDTADRLGYKKKIIYPKISDVVYLNWSESDDELVNKYNRKVQDEVIKQAKKTNVEITVINKKDTMKSIPKTTKAFIANGWMNRSELKELYKRCKIGVFIGTSPDEKHFSSVKSNYDSFVRQIIDYLVEKGYKSLGYIGICDWNIDTEKPSMDVREWSFMQTADYYGLLNKKNIITGEKHTVEEGHKMGLKAAEQGKLPEAFVISDDVLAVGVLQAFSEKGIHVPEDVSIYSIGDIDVAKYMAPPLTTFYIDVSILASTSIELMRERVLSTEKVTKTVLVNGIPTIRKSVKI
jgi:LacI family transcriptional regulator